MSVTRIASRYAKSLLDLAVEQGKLDTVVEDVKTFSGAIAHRDLHLLLKSPIVHGSKKQEIFKEIFGGKLDPLTMGFFEIAIRKGREMFLPEMAGEFMEQYKVLKEISTVTITTAQPLSASALEAIKAKLLGSDLTKKSVEIETAVDADLIGGFLVQVGDKLVDASVAHQLKQAAKAIAE